MTVEVYVSTDIEADEAGRGVRGGRGPLPAGSRRSREGISGIRGSIEREGRRHRRPPASRLLIGHRRGVAEAPHRRHNLYRPIPAKPHRLRAAPGEADRAGIGAGVDDEVVLDLVDLAAVDQVDARPEIGVDQLAVGRQAGLPGLA